MTNRIALPLLALLVASGCRGSDATAPMADDTSPTVSASAASARNSRRGALHLTKECSTYLGRAKDLCTITSSNINEIKVGSTVVYQQPAGPASLDSDVIVYPPNSRRNIAFGHCALDFATGLGHCEFSGGTEKFAGFSANVIVSCALPNCALDGSYSFSNRADQD